MCGAWRITDLIHLDERCRTVLLSHKMQDVAERRSERNHVAVLQRTVQLKENRVEDIRAVDGMGTAVAIHEPRLPGCALPESETRQLRPDNPPVGGFTQLRLPGRTPPLLETGRARPEPPRRDATHKTEYSRIPCTFNGGEVRLDDDKSRFGGGDAPHAILRRRTERTDKDERARSNDPRAQRQHHEQKAAPTLLPFVSHHPQGIHSCHEALWSTTISTPPVHASARSSRQFWFIHDSVAKNTMSRRKLSCCFRTHSSPDCR